MALVERAGDFWFAETAQTVTDSFFKSNYYFNFYFFTVGCSFGSGQMTETS